MGYIIVIEGTDGCGKQTQTTKLYERLVGLGYNVMRQSFPAYDSASSGPVKMYLGGELGSSDMSLDAYQASSLYAVDRLCTYYKDLKGFYENGGVILFDRYVSSNMLHQAGKIRDRVEVDKFLEWLDALEFGTLKLPRPDRVVFLDVPVEISFKIASAREEQKNGKAKDIHELNPEHLQRSYESGKYVAEKYGWTTIPCVEGDGLRTIDSIHADIFDAVIADLKVKMDK
ncbi:MAG: thymidylate kinase [Clostridiales bacterium]|nr:thymidylate kinase [Clostridiales bacterium]